MENNFHWKGQICYVHGPSGWLFKCGAHCFSIETLSSETSVANLPPRTPECFEQLGPAMAGGRRADDSARSVSQGSPRRQ